MSDTGNSIPKAIMILLKKQLAICTYMHVSSGRAYIRSNLRNMWYPFKPDRLPQAFFYLNFKRTLSGKFPYDTVFASRGEVKSDNLPSE